MAVHAELRSSRLARLCHLARDLPSRISCRPHAIAVRRKCVVPDPTRCLRIAALSTFTASILAKNRLDIPVTASEEIAAFQHRGAFSLVLREKRLIAGHAVNLETGNRARQERWTG